MSKAGAFDLASGLGGKIEKDDVLSAVDKYISLYKLLNLFNFLKSLLLGVYVIMSRSVPHNLMLFHNSN